MHTMDHTSAFSLHSVPASTSGAAQSKVLCMETWVFSLLRIFASPTLHQKIGTLSTGSIQGQECSPGV